MLTAIQQQRLRLRPCGCGEALLDSAGLVLRVEFCPACLENALDFLRKGCYDANAFEGVSHERQLDMFLEHPAGETPHLPF